MAPARLLAEAVFDMFVLVQARTGARYFRLMDEKRLSLAQYRALSVLARSPTTRTVKELASAVSLSAPATSRMVDDMVERGLVTRREDDDDRRQRRLGLTVAGRGLVELLDEARLSELTAFLERLGPDQRRALIEAVQPVLGLGRDPVS